MANPEHLAKLKEGVEAWNEWRKRDSIKPDLSGGYLIGANLSEADLPEADLRKTDLRGADLCGANLRGADLCGANLSGADLSEANLRGTNLSEADLRGANLRETNMRGVNLCMADLMWADLRAARLHRPDLKRADLRMVNLSGANLSGANLRDANLLLADLGGAGLNGTDFSFAFCGRTHFDTVDLSAAVGLEFINHEAPSSIGTDTLYLSKGKIPEAFLRGCGVPENLIEYLPSLVTSLEPLQFYSCFISYSHIDEDFARRLHARMEEEHLRVWYAPKDMRGGRKIHEQLFEAIWIYDKLLLVLSDDSMESEWVRTEIRRARKRELAERRQILFPVRLVGMDAVRTWECFDTDSGKDLAVEIREYHIPDFSGWKDHDAFEAAFTRLLRDLKAEGETKGK